MIAAAVLMPDEMVQALYEKKLSVSELAEEFGVSEIAMENKLKSMGFETLESTPASDDNGR
jgi:Zn-dependent peptidase ImmA (M78 family)